MATAVLVTVLVGISIAVQTAVVGRFSSTVHPLAVSMSLMLAGVLAGGAWSSARGAWPQVLAITVRWWSLPLGVAGWAIVAALGWTAERLGVASALALVVAAQLTTALVIDGARGTVELSPRPLLGVFAMLAGVLLLRPT